MANLSTRLDALRATIEKLMSIGGTPGLSLGVMHQGRQVYYAAYGHSDVEKGLPITDETVLPVCSMTEAVTSAALGILMEENKANWDTLIKDALPSFNINDDILQNNLTITDLLCHRSGKSWGDNLFVGTENNILISEKDSMKYINSQTRLLHFCGQLSYNNMGFELAGKVIEALSGQSYFDFLQTRIFDPLGMDRTFLQTPPSSLEDIGTTYNALDDGCSVRIPAVKAGDDWFGTPSAGMRSCVGQLVLEEFIQAPDVERNDYLKAAESSRAENLKWYPSLMHELAQERKYDTSAKPLEEYVCTYWDAIHVFKIDVVLKEGQLYWLLQGLESEKFLLNNYEDDLFTWLLPRNELSKRGRWVGGDEGPDFWKAVFKTGDGGKIDKLSWSHDNGIAAVEYKKG
ncbi:beta-lactamase/transpeptidase-like protein [Mytilinidion resinicola]|uniref:Beta-lactamase/transpeptidase-like protein n=1 Tax=Mytilinidion resinicola TaxID=574789 RepID=A0A6A6Y8D9_9PEZI|nr:beta-lactamase/transpeptidase-like protein [Mytilinidion resinicola]KAF2804960.1 beta-lactamase/transpeptidase-like protein [Mytilinidion resinicola]